MKTIHEKSTLIENSHIYLAKCTDVYNLSHYHTEHELICAHKGSTHVTVDGVNYELTEGEALFVHSEEIHYIRTHPNSQIWVLKADPSYYKSLLWGKKLVSPRLGNSYNINSALEQINKELRSGNEYSGVIADSLVTVLIARILSHEATVACTSPSRHKIIAGENFDRISQKITEEYATVTFDEIASFAHYSKPYFSKFFKSYFGMSFVEYLNTIKIAAAVDMIKEKKLSITEVAEKCGFNTIRNFNRVFKMITGYSPCKLPDNYVFIYNLDRSTGLDPTLSCTEIFE